MVGLGSSPSKSPALKLSPTTYQTTPSRLLLLLLTTGDSLELLSAELLDSTSALELLDSTDSTSSLELFGSIELLDSSTEDELPQLESLLLDNRNSSEEECVPVSSAEATGPSLDELSPHEAKQKRPIANVTIA